MQLRDQVENTYIRFRERLYKTNLDKPKIGKKRRENLGKRSDGLHEETENSDDKESS